jgi:hypothetical protein
MSSKPKLFLTYSVLFVVIIAFYSIIYLQTVDAPYLDDYNGIFDFIIRFREDKDWSLRFQHIFRQHNQHRIAYARLLLLVQYGLTGVINLKTTILIGTAHLLLIAFLFGRYIWENTKNSYLLIPLVLIWFHFQHFENIIWAETSIQNISVVALALSAAWLLSRPAISVYWPIFVAVLATFASGNGVFVWASGLAVLVLAKRWRHLAIWCGSAVVFIFLFSYHLRVNDQNTQTSFDVFNIAKGMLILAGGSLEFTDTDYTWFTVAWGTIVYICLLYCFWRFFAPEKSAYLFSVGAAVFVLLSMASITIVRDSFVENRYKINSSLLIVIIYTLLAIAENTKHKIASYWAYLAVGAGLFSLFTLWNYWGRMVGQRESNLTGAFNVINHPAYGTNTTFRQRIDYLVNNRIWQIPPVAKKEFSPLNNLEYLMATSKAKDWQSAHAREFVYGDSSFNFKAYEAIVDSVGNQDFTYLLTTPGKGSPTGILVMKRDRKPLIDFLKSGEYFEEKAYFTISELWFNKGIQGLYVYQKGMKPHFLGIYMKVEKNGQTWLSERWFNYATH